MEGESDFRHWDELTPDALGLIFKNLELQEVLQVIPSVCKSWCKVVEGPYCWERIDIDEWSKTKENSPEQIDRMLRTLITRSSGSLRELRVSCVKSNQMFSFIAENAGSLQTLIFRRSTIDNSTVARLASKFSSLTTLDMSECNLVKTEALEAIGRNCKNLVSLSLKCDPYYLTCDQANEVRAITSTMPKLKHLSLAHREIKDRDVLKILSLCPELESLDIQGCFYVSLDSYQLEDKYPKLKLVGPLVYSEDDSSCYEDDDSCDEEWLDGNEP